MIAWVSAAEIPASSKDVGDRRRSVSFFLGSVMGHEIAASAIIRKNILANATVMSAGDRLRKCLHGGVGCSLIDWAFS